MNKDFNYADVVFNLPVNQVYTYFIPDDLKPDADIGKRVLAQLGKRKYTGVVINLHDQTPVSSINIKKIISILDDLPILNSEMMRFCKWISGYYIAPYGEVLFAALPKGITVQNKFLYSFNELKDNYLSKLTPLQTDVINILKEKPQTALQIERKLNRKGIYSVLKSLVTSEYVKISELTDSEKIKPKFENFVKFEMLDDFREISQEMLYNFFKENKIKTDNQLNAVNYLIRKCIDEIKVSELISKSSSTMLAIKSLEKKEILRIEKREVTREPEYEFEEKAEEFILNKDQVSVINSLNNAIDEEKFYPSLLYGVTGSGKTQVYIEIIKYLLKKNKTAIVLVPEISLTPQLIQRFRHNFGGIVGVIHSRLSAGERYDVFRNIQKGDIKLVIGPRSALFAPFTDLGMIIIDEEHDSSYKQNELIPRYHARDAALIRGKFNNAVVLMGSATPSLESYYNALNGKYKLLNLPERAQNTRLPDVEVVNMLAELKSASKFQKYENLDRRFLSLKLIYYMDLTVQMGKSIILLQNRRGYSSYLECQDCGYVKMCENCDITLTYHKRIKQLLCHYCGTYYEIPVDCSRCGSKNIEFKGTGTEKIEEEIQRLFPNVKVRRMDSDTTSRKDAHRSILKSFHDGEFQVLVGTQMISKGLDFPRVQLVGVINADIGLFNPDFRSTEKTFQLLMQVSGRSGRNTDTGKVIIQTLHPMHPLFTYIKTHDYLSFYNKEIESRKQFDYPPFSRLVLIEVNGLNVKQVYTLASRIYMFLTKVNSSNDINILNPAPSIIYKLKNKYRYNVIIKTKKFVAGLSDREDLKLYNIHQALLLKLKGYIGSLTLKSDQKIIIDVDPIDFY